MYADAGFWDGIAESYAAKPVDDPEAFERKIAITQRLMKPDHVVLDVGCGTGSLALRLAPHAARVHGLDISSEMIRIARGKARDQGVDNVTFHVGAEHETMDFEAEGLDGICAYSILHLVEDRPAMLDRLYSWLKPGGFLVSSTVTLGDSWFPYGAMITIMRWAGRAPSVQMVKRRTLQQEVERAGFVDVQLPDVGAQSQITFLVARKPV